MKLMRAGVQVFTLGLVIAGCGTEDSKRMGPIDASIGGDQDATVADVTMAEVTLAPKDTRGTDGASEDAGADTVVDVCTAPKSDDGGTGILNGGFESPVVAAAGFQLISTGATIAGWTVVGKIGNVAPIGTAFTENGISFAARTCGQSLDLTGTSSTETGVSQSVTTLPGTNYTLSFWVGNVVDTKTNIYGTASTIKVLVDDAVIVTAVNSDGVGATSLAWKPFSVSFIAASSSTKIAFINGDPPGDHSNFLDDVVLR